MQKSEPSLDGQDAMEPGWKFDEKDAAEHYAEHADEEDKEPDRYMSAREFESHSKAGTVETKTANLIEQAKTEERITESHKLRSFLIALLICAVLYLIIFFFWHSGNFNAPVVPAITHFRNLTANAAINPNTSSGVIHVSGIISPPPKSTNSVVIISVVSPRGL